MNEFAPWTDYWIFGAVMSLLLGLTWGSFFNVFIYRVPVRKSIVKPGSHCYHCGSFLKWYDNIPLVSYLLLRGNCRSCGTHFSSRYFFIELLSGLVFLGIFVRFGIQWALPFHFVFASMLIIGMFTDIDHFILPDSLTIGGFGFALAVALILGGHAIVLRDYFLTRDLYYSFFAPNRMGHYGYMPRYASFLWALVGAGFGYGLLSGVGLLGRLMFSKEGLGGGDVKLFAFLGAYLGVLNCLWILFLSAFIGSIVGLSLLLTHRLLRKDEYEELVLAPHDAVKSPWRTVKLHSAAQGQLDSILATYSDPQSQQTDLVGDANLSVDTTSEREPAAIILRIARRTMRQMHHIPYGPYIAVAAIIVLIAHEWIDRNTREFLMLPF